MANIIRILCFEDSKQYIESLKLYFMDSDEIYLTASFYNATKVLKHIRDFQPDVILMDIEMPEISGIEALQKIKEAYPDTKILMVTSFEDNHKIFASILGGASGYVLKSMGLEQLKQSIIDVYNGGGYLSPSIAKRVIKMFQIIKPDKGVDYFDLTTTELQVLKCMAKGLSYKMIEVELQKSYHAVHFHIKNIYKKLHVNSKSEAIIKAIENHLI